MAKRARSHVLVAAGLGDGSREEQRIVELLADVAPERWPFDRSRKPREALRLLARLLRAPPALFVVEGTGLGVCVPAILARWLRGVPYVVSSGDAVGPFFRLHGRIAGAFGAIYERVLCRNCAGFIGWTPYLVGRALTFGAPAGVTAAGWAKGGFDPEARARVRERLGIGTDAPVFGIVGSLIWTEAKGYCYGLELVQAIRSTQRPDVRVVVVGDGDGLEHLRAAAGDDERIVFTGRVDQSEVAAMLSAMDYASLPQSRDGVGIFRYTTKVSEYLAAGLPILTGRLPFAYDLSHPSIRRVAGSSPWDPDYVDALAALMATSEVGPRPADTELELFDRALQRSRVGSFVADLLEEGRAG